MIKTQSDTLNQAHKEERDIIIEKTLVSYETGRERLYHANYMVLEVIKRYERETR